MNASKLYSQRNIFSDYYYNDDNNENDDDGDDEMVNTTTLYLYWSHKKNTLI